MRSTRFFLGAVLTIGLLGSSANADPRTDKSIAVAGIAPNTYNLISSIVHFDDLDVDNPKDATTLLDRINNVAIRICTVKHDIELPRTRAKKVEKCRSTAVAEAVTALDAPEVTRALQAAHN